MRWWNNGLRMWRSLMFGMDGAGFLGLVGLSVGAVGIGWASVMIGGVAGDKPVMLAVMPLVLLTAFLFIYSREAFLIVVLLIRAGANPIFEQARMAAVGGLGGLLNALVILLAALIISRDPKRIPKAAWWVWGPLLAMQAIGLVYSPEKVAAIRLYLGYLSVVALFLVSFYLVQDEFDFNKMLKIITWSSVPVALVSLAYIAMGRTAGGGDALENSGLRYGGPFPHANILAFYLVMSLGVLFYRWKSRQIGQTVFTAAVVVGYMLLLLGLLYTTKTRSAWISVLFIFAMYGLVKERRYLLYLVMMGAAGFLALPELRERVMGLTEGNEVVQYAKLNSFAWRKLLWTDALAWMSPTRYLMGYGAESFFALSPTFFSMAGPAKWGAHSAVVQTFFELGALGLGAYLWLYYSTARMIRRLFAVKPLLALIGMCLLVANFMVSSSDNMFAYLIYNWYFWFCMGCLCSLAMRLVPDGALEGRYRRTWGIRPSPQARARGEASAAAERSMSATAWLNTVPMGLTATAGNSSAITGSGSLKGPGRGGPRGPGRGPGKAGGRGTDGRPPDGPPDRPPGVPGR
ncbi:O-antigen ligase family protein [Roseateles sp. SL47]|uniref:O-antigen ligase family protein n=1 Tax=Roseateles sp. SL47 TaxID=2995138 RepID=UPI00226EF7F4|nr:O-antigen ligase family protein [Roseateles sp. SL47]WAC75144.1 O-antigen ligase family protein [Roseateles sp. SL47]